MIKTKIVKTEKEMIDNILLDYRAGMQWDEVVEKHIPILKAYKKRYRVQKKQRIISAHEAARTFFCQYYKENFKTKYRWNSTNGRMLKEILLQIEDKLEEKDIQITDENLTEAFQRFISKIKLVCDNWLWARFTLANINNQFNPLYVKMLNGGKINVKKTRFDKFGEVVNKITQRENN